MIINGAAYGQDSTYNAVRLAASMAKRDEVSLRTCMDARGVAETMLVEGAVRSTMDDLTDWTLAAEKVLVF